MCSKTLKIYTFLLKALHLAIRTVLHVLLKIRVTAPES